MKKAVETKKAKVCFDPDLSPGPGLRPDVDLSTDLDPDQGVPQGQDHVRRTA